MITCAIRIKLMLDAAMYMLEALPTIHEFRHNPCGRMYVSVDET